VRRTNVVLVISESVRADAMCSSASSGCNARFLDEVASDRISLGRFTSQSSGTFTSCVLAWTGLAPDADFRTMHRAPVLWEIAHAIGYRTAYIGAQNLRYDDFGAFLQNAGIDTSASAIDLGEASDPHIGAPDENATRRMLDFVREVPAGTPYFAVLHLSNTHWPYRVDPALQPYGPHEASIVDNAKLRNHYRNSVLLQERTMGAFLRDLRSVPSWDDTVVLFVSDHGEEFREHGGLYHLTSLFDEQVRVPGFLLAGARALDPTQRAALATYAQRRTYSQDLHATVLDLFGVYDEHTKFPFADRVTGRSLLRETLGFEPAVVLSTASGVWEEPDSPKYGIMRGDLLAVRSARGPWQCYDAKSDPGQHAQAPIERCSILIGVGDERFAAALKK
jgi:arylsulfatase A-like enzyme